MELHLPGSGVTRLLLMPGPRELTCSGVGKCILMHAKHAHTIGGLGPSEIESFLDYSYLLTHRLSPMVLCYIYVHMTHDQMQVSKTDYVS